MIVKSMIFEEILEEYNNCGYSLRRRTTPQPHEQGSWEQKVIGILLNRGCLTLPLNDPIYFVLSLIFYLSEEGYFYILSTFLPLGHRATLLGEDLRKIFNALETYYGNLEVYDKITSKCTFDPGTGILEYRR